MAVNEYMTVEELVAKHYSMSNKINGIKFAIKQLQGNNWHDTEVIERAEKDQRYAMQLLVNDYKRLMKDLSDFEDRQVVFINA